MSPQPGTITSLHAEPAIAETVLTWDPLGWDPLIDHYRIYAVAGESAPPEPHEQDLLGKTVYPHFVHDGQDPAGEEGGGEECFGIHLTLQRMGLPEM